MKVIKGICSGIDKFNDIKLGDILEAYEMEEYRD